MVVPLNFIFKFIFLTQPIIIRVTFIFLVYLIMKRDKNVVAPSFPMLHDSVGDGLGGGRLAAWTTSDKRQLSLQVWGKGWEAFQKGTLLAFQRPTR